MVALKLLKKANDAGLAVRIEGERLVVRGPRNAEKIAKELLDNKEQVVQALVGSITKSKFCDSDTTHLNPEKNEGSVTNAASAPRPTEPKWGRTLTWDECFPPEADRFYRHARAIRQRLGPAQGINRPPELSNACPRCHATKFTDVPIHEGRSTRRDCDRCGFTIGFPTWYGQPR
jgi:hypothetical protein